MLRIYADICKVEEQDDGTLVVSGLASTPHPDAVGETITADAMKAALPGYMKFPALREMHQLKAAGSTLSAEVDADGNTVITAKVVDAEAVRKVREGTYRGFSVGGKALGRDPKDRKVITKLSLSEISLVDRPCNPEAVFDVWKAAITNGEAQPQEADMEMAEAPTADIEKTEAETVPTQENTEASPSDDAVVKIEAEAIAPAEAAPAPEAAPDVAARATAAVDALAAAVEKAAQDGDVRKGMYDVQAFASVLTSLSNIVRDAANEADWEGDNSPVPAKLRAAFQGLAIVFQEMAAEEVSELLAATAATSKAEDAGDIVKAAAAERDDALAKAAEAQETLAKLADRIEPLVATVESLSDRLAKVEAQPAPPKAAAGAVSKAVSKEEDAAGGNAAGAPDADAIAKAFAALSPEERTIALIKASHLNPVLVSAA